MTFTIEGAPRTKSNSPRIARTKGGKRFVLPSKASVAWEASAIGQLLKQRKAPALAVPVNCRALVYRERNGPGDASNYYKAIGDALERGRAVVNDRLIVSWDGSRILLDRKRPRVEITLEPL